MPKKRPLIEFKGFLTRPTQSTARSHTPPPSEIPVPPPPRMPRYHEDAPLYDSDDVAELEARKEYTARHHTHHRHRHHGHHHRHHHRHRSHHHRERDRERERERERDRDRSAMPPDDLALARASRAAERAERGQRPRASRRSVPPRGYAYRRTDYDSRRDAARAADPHAEPDPEAHLDPKPDLGDTRSREPSVYASERRSSRGSARYDRALGSRDAARDAYPQGTHLSPEANIDAMSRSRELQGSYEASRMYQPEAPPVPIGVAPNALRYPGAPPRPPPGAPPMPLPQPPDPRVVGAYPLPVPEGQMLEEAAMADEYDEMMRRRYEDEHYGYYRRRRHPHYRRHHRSRRRRRKRRRRHVEHGSSSSSQEGEDDSSSKKSHKSKKKSSEDGSDKDSSSSDSKESKIFTKKRVAKAGLATLLAVGAGLVAKKVLSNRKKKKEQQQLQQGEAASEYETGEEGSEEDGTVGGYYPEPVFRAPPIPAKSMFGVTVPPNQVCIVEKGGRYHRTLNSGNHFLSPVGEKVAYCHSMKELAIPVPWQECYSSDNIPFRANGMLYMRIEDPVAASYGVDNPYHSIVLLAQTVMRNHVARLTKERSFQDRVRLGDRILDEINDASRSWGVRCLKFEFRDMELPLEIQEQIEAEEEEERQMRMAEMQAEADRIAAVNKAEAEFQAQAKASQARQLEIVNQAIGEAHAIQERGEAVANALRDVAQVVNEPGGEQAMQMRLAEQFIDAYSRATRAPTVSPPDPNNVASNMNNAIGLLNTLGDNAPSTQIPTVPMHQNPFVEKPKVAKKPKPTPRPAKARPPPGYPGSQQNDAIPAPVKIKGAISAPAKVSESDLSSESDQTSQVESEDDPKLAVHKAKLKQSPVPSGYPQVGRAAQKRGSRPESSTGSRDSRQRATRPARASPSKASGKPKPKPKKSKDALKAIKAAVEGNVGNLQDTMEGLLDRF